ncbi:hypothetical protein [Desulfosporosinus sp. Sb-LF]|uniref:hypothetical protein n=1 Tax=Desulfosporosinus sp. Sb-LF TaxID=2560027 RepID=UPI00107F9B1B|nr:hypothetical protein [Desulfosporosinus sp. Sb-LF]TGE34608.1 hypothetical protein E4K68_02800 [Desulfosporosinus sp. Sb-LF]
MMLLLGILVRECSLQERKEKNVRCEKFKGQTRLYKDSIDECGYFSISLGTDFSMVAIENVSNKKVLKTS